MAGLYGFREVATSQSKMTCDLHLIKGAEFGTCGTIIIDWLQVLPMACSRHNDGDETEGNQMVRRILATSMFAVGFISSSAIAAEYVLDVTAKPEQTSRFEDGREAVDSATPTSSARILEPRQQTSKQGGFRVYVVNNSGKPFNFGPESITVKMQDGTTIAMLSYQELLKKEERRQAWRAFAVNLAAASRNLQASQAGQRTEMISYSGSTNGTFGGTPFAANSSGTAMVSRHDPSAVISAQLVADQQNQRDIAAMQLTQAAKREDLAQMLKMTTVDHEQVFGGVVHYLIPPTVRASKAPVPITIEVRAGDEVHTFQVTLAKYKG